MFSKILHRMILWELIKVFGLSLIAIMSLLIMAGIVAEATQQGLKPNQILAVIPLLVPNFLPYTIPATTLFATCIVYGRLAADNEVLAIKAAGINVLLVVWPGLLLGVVMSAATLGLYYHVIPHTIYLLRSRIMNDMEEYMYDMLKRDKCIRQPKLPYVMFVRQVNGTRLEDALFKRLDRQGHYDVVARSREAELHFDKKNHQILVRMLDGDVLGSNGSNAGYFKDKLWEVPLPADFGIEPRPRARALDWDAVLRRRQDLLAEQAKLEPKIEAAKADVANNRPAPALDSMLNQSKGNVIELHVLDAELWMRGALSFGCLCFVLVGCPVGVWFSKSDYLSAFITCFLPVVFTYYPLLLCCSNYAKSGVLPAIMCAPNALMVFAGLVLFKQLLRH
ncbi:MAG TPA: LptF/LptG family permease [Gemmataceae bacterium]|nr:LptF/LptG family permease [Gemmataceae bacterium]